MLLGREATNQQTHVGPVVKASASRAADLGSIPVDGFPGGISGHTGDIDIATPVPYPARGLALEGQHWDWLARCRYTVSG